MVEPPDSVVRHRPKVCSQCCADLSTVPGRVAERRQVLDVPEIRLLAHEHQSEAICCPTCHRTSLGSFPTSVSAPVQYGPHLQALAVYLHQGQLLPTARTCEALAALCGCHIAEATLLQWSELAAERLAPTVERIAELIVASRIPPAHPHRWTSIDTTSGKSKMKLAREDNPRPRRTAPANVQPRDARVQQNPPSSSVEIRM